MEGRGREARGWGGLPGPIMAKSVVLIRPWGVKSENLECRVRVKSLVLGNLLPKDKYP